MKKNMMKQYTVANIPFDRVLANGIPAICCHPTEISHRNGCQPEGGAYSDGQRVAARADPVEYNGGK